jgi:hypothetical protein
MPKTAINSERGVPNKNDADQATNRQIQGRFKECRRSSPAAIKLLIASDARGRRQTREEIASRGSLTVLYFSAICGLRYVCSNSPVDVWDF